MNLPDYINPDDDDEVEQYKQQMEKRAAKRKVEAHKKYFAALSDNARIDVLAGDVHRIVTDIKDEYSPFILNEVALFVLDPDMLWPGGVVLVGFRDGYNVTEEAILLNKVCSDPNGIPMSMSDELHALMSTFQTPSLAVPALVDSSPATKDLPSERQAQLIKLWGHWFSGEKDWSRFHMSGSHRPSLGSWAGMPWEPMNFANKAVGRGIGKGVQYAMEWTPGLVYFRAMHPQLGIPEQPLWVLRTGDGDDEEAGAGASSSSSSSKPAKAPKPSGPIPAPPSLEAIKTFITQAQQVARLAKDKGTAKKATGSAKGASSAKAAPAKKAPAKAKAAAPKKVCPKASAVAKGKKGGK